MSSYYRQQLEAWLKTIDVKADRVLDIGGSANPVKDRMKSWEVKEYLIMDNCAEERYHKGFRRPDIKGDLNDDFMGLGGSRFRELMATFDVVFCLEVAEYLFNPCDAIRSIGWLLKAEGVLYMSFPAVYPVHNPKEIDYLRYTRRGVEKLLEVAGFKQWEITPRVATKGRRALGEFYSLERMHPIKGDDIIYDIGYLVKAVK